MLDKELDVRRGTLDVLRLAANLRHEKADRFAAFLVRQVDDD
jgi:hypothetical protein